MIYLVLIVFGLALGSFVNALVWRLHEQEIESGKKSTAKRQAYVKDLSVVKGRSMCLHCHYQLAIKDLIPLFSWLGLRGRCRYCHQPIGWQYPLAELLTAVLFVFSYLYWPLALHGTGLAQFIIWLLLLVGFMALAVYDLKWYLLPNRIVYPLLGLALLQFIVMVVYQPRWSLVLSAAWGVLIGGGIFYLLFQISKGRWIGGGDVKLGALLGIIVGGPLAAIVLLFTASLTGTLVSVPMMLSGRVKRNTQVPFGPFLLFAAFLVRLFGSATIKWLQQRALLP